jgi:hypothetical protein
MLSENFMVAYQSTLQFGDFSCPSSRVHEVGKKKIITVITPRRLGWSDKEIDNLGWTGE